MNLRKKTFLAAIAILLSASALVWSGRERPRPPAVPTTGSPDAQIPTLSATGRVEARSEAVVRAKGSGRLVQYLKKEGDWAEAGETVAVLDQAMERSALREAEAEVFQTESKFRRAKTMHSEQVISDQDYDDADAAYRLAQARREKAEAALDERTIRAPFSGRILKTYLEPGESIDARGSETELFVIGDTRSLKVRAEVDEQDIARVAAGSRAEVRADAFPDQIFPGKVSAISGILGRKKLRSDDPKERMDAKVLEVLIDLPASQQLRPGVTVEVKIAAETGKEL